MNNQQQNTYLISKINELLRILDTDLNLCIKLMDQEKYNDCKKTLINTEKILNDTVFNLTLNLSKCEGDKK